MVLCFPCLNCPTLQYKEKNPSDLTDLKGILMKQVDQCSILIMRWKFNSPVNVVLKFHKLTFS